MACSADAPGESPPRRKKIARREVDFNLVEERDRLAALKSEIAGLGQLPAWVSGVSVMKRAMWTADPIGGQYFSDRTAGQQTLLSPDPDRLRLRAMLQAPFRVRDWVSIQDVEHYTLPASSNMA